MKESSSLENILLASDRVNPFIFDQQNIIKNKLQSIPENIHKS